MHPLYQHLFPLIHKAVGWVLHDVGNHDLALRYTIEKLDESERQYYMHPDISEFDLGMASLKKGKTISISKNLL